MSAWPPPGNEHEGDDEDDLPILTEVVEGFERPPGRPVPPLRATTGVAHGQPAAVQAPGHPQISADAGAVTRDAASARLTAQLAALDTDLAREISDWVAAELPQVLAHELDQLAARVQAEMQARLRVTLLPEISACVGRLLDQAIRPSAGTDRPLDS